MLTGDHPQSYTQRPPTSSLILFSKPRPKTPTPHLRMWISQVSPELTNAFPRRANMTVRDAITTGFDGRFINTGRKGLGVGVEGILSDKDVEWREKRVEEVLKRLGPHTWSSTKGNHDDSFGQRSFVSLSAGEQSVVLLMRALVGRPPIVLLDEVWSGMDSGMIEAARDYLRGDGVGEEQAVIVISHWEDEVPWSLEDGLQTFKLESGGGIIIDRQ